MILVIEYSRTLQDTLGVVQQYKNEGKRFCIRFVHNPETRVKLINDLKALGFSVDHRFPESPVVEIRW